MRALLLLLLVLCAWFAAATGSAQEKAGVCIKCKGVGKLLCEEHPREEIENEDQVLYCSVIADCTSCFGVGWLACAQCKHEEAAKAFETKKQGVQTRRTALKYLDEGMKRPLRKAESAHYVMVWELDKLKVDKRMLNGHQLLHLYLERMELLHTDYRSVLQVTDKVFRQKMRVLVWYLPDDKERGSALFCGQSGRTGVKLMGVDPTYSVCASRQNFQNDERLHRSMVHNVAHLLLSHHAPSQWIGNIKGGWADEGFGHWWEDRYWGICDTYCYQEQNTIVEFKSGKYRLAVRQMVAAGTNPPSPKSASRTWTRSRRRCRRPASAYVD